MFFVCGKNEKQKTKKKSTFKRMIIIDSDSNREIMKQKREIERERDVPNKQTNKQKIHIKRVNKTEKKP